MLDDIPKIRRIGHVALYVKDPTAAAQWYVDVLGMRIVAEAGDGPYSGGIFLSFGTSDHDIGLFRAGPDAPKGREFEHIGLELDCGGNLGLLQRFHSSLVRHRVRIHEVLDHGVSKGIYFFDPDGHMLEVYCQELQGNAALEALRQNRGMAEPYELEPVA